MSEAAYLNLFFYYTVYACTFLSEISEKSSHVMSNQQCNAQVVMYVVAL